MRRLAACVVAIALIGAACSSSGDGDQRASDREQVSGDEPLDALLIADFDEKASTQAAIEALAASGVEVYDDEDFELVNEPDGTPSVFRYTEFQARNMALEVATGAGIRGEDLDWMAPAINFEGSDVPVTPSMLVAAWAVEAQTPGAELARQILGDFDPKASAQMTFPSLVLALFLADAVPPVGGDSAEGGQGFVGAPGEELAAAQGGPCGEARRLLEQLDQLLAEYQASGGIFGWIVGGLSRVGLAVTIEIVLAQLAPIRVQLETAAAVAYAASLLRDWGLEIKPDPATAHHRVGGGDVRATYTAEVIGDEGVEYPEWVKECAALFRLPLPNAQSSDGMEIVWTPGAGFGEHALPVPPADTKIQPGGTAKFPFTTPEEDEATHNSGLPERSGTAAMGATVERTIDPEQISRFVSGVTGLPSAATSAVGQAVAEGINVIDVTGTGSAVISYHSAPASFDVVVSDSGTLHAQGYNCAGLYGTWTVNIDIDPGGEQTTTFTITEDNPSSTLSWSIPIPESVHNGSLGVTLSGDQLVFSGGLNVTSPLGYSARGQGATVPIQRGPVPQCE